MVNESALFLRERTKEKEWSQDKQVEQAEVVHRRISCGNIQLVLLQLSVQPAVPLFLDEQDDDVTVFEAQECGVVACRVGEDGPDTGLSAHVETG